ncbi:hypothetical protein PGT21_020862 [Puccinia graminis f. sp. tritici]|uniref:Uncharacterized protein n=1 Tax=Puccinia graminis f. sp. tritici TaxID=56615 RepID=A0A5B0N2Z1_PUCGR|nr:hypothetical protein PGT21_020862 [Puccinia graminis f. sp. tritici]
MKVPYNFSTEERKRFRYLNLVDDKAVITALGEQEKGVAATIFQSRRFELRYLYQRNDSGVCVVESIRLPSILSSMNEVVYFIMATKSFSNIRRYLSSSSDNPSQDS